MKGELLRLCLSLGLVALSILVWRVANAAILARADRRVSHLDGWRQGRPSLVYFTTANCAPCRTVQRPAIRKVQEALGQEVLVFEIDAGSQPQLAQEWGVLSVPTTFVVDARGKPRQVNHGVASFEKLAGQLEAARRHPRLDAVHG